MDAGTSPKDSILLRANEIINGERAKDYGSVSENFERIAAGWEIILGTKVTATDVALCMSRLKISRLVNSPDHEDSWMDIAGYVGCWDKMQKGE